MIAVDEYESFLIKMFLLSFILAEICNSSFVMYSYKNNCYTLRSFEIITSFISRNKFIQVCGQISIRNLIIAVNKEQVNIRTAHVSDVNFLDTRFESGM
jgi:hypothetical protein